MSGSGVDRWATGEPRAGDCMLVREGAWHSQDCLSTDRPRAFLAEKVYIGNKKLVYLSHPSRKLNLITRREDN